MYHFEIQLGFVLFFNLFSFHAESNGIQSLIQHCPDLNET